MIVSRMDSTSISLQHLRSILRVGDVRAALIFLNGLTEHRFSALYRFDADTLTNKFFFDRENPAVELTPDIPIMASYCVHVRSTHDTFKTPDSLHDARVEDHPKRQEVRSYCGVPLCDVNGEVFGSICHFDFRPLSISDSNVQLMEAVAPLIKNLDNSANGAILRSTRSR